ncbi:MAG: M14 family zinc carboxypeptidase [Promethearchaeota archaeon]
MTHERVIGGFTVYKEILDQVPAYKEFLTVDELDDSSRHLAAEFAHVDLLTIGASTAERPILSLKIGEGTRTALLFAFPHPNEPIGSLTVEFLARFLAEHPDITQTLGYTWYLIKAVDPDGAALNEGWFKGKFDPVKYARHFYRPASHEQIEWTFPVHYKHLSFSNPPPETQALMRIIDQTKPDFMFSLHNAGFCGVYWYITHSIKELYPDLTRMAAREQLPLHRGEPEAPYIKKLHPAIFQMFGIQSLYDFYEANGSKAPHQLIKCGTSSDDYLLQATKGKGFTLVCEMPYFYDKALGDDSATEYDRRQLRLDNLDHALEIYRYVQLHFKAIRPYCDSTSRIFTAVADAIDNYEKRIAPRLQHAKTAAMYEGKATVAQAFDSQVASKYYRVLLPAMVARLCDDATPTTPAAQRLLEKTKSELNQWVAHTITTLLKGTDFEVIPIQKLVKVQVGSALSAIRYLPR